jgi:hypothetical protein
MNKHNNDILCKISVSEQEIEDWVLKEAPHISDVKWRRDYYKKNWNVAAKIKKAKKEGNF